MTKELLKKMRIVEAELETIESHLKSVKDKRRNFKKTNGRVATLIQEGSKNDKSCWLDSDSYTQVLDMLISRYSRIVEDKRKEFEKL